MDGWMDRGMDGRSVGRLVEWMDRRMDSQNWGILAKIPLP